MSTAQFSSTIYPEGILPNVRKSIENFYKVGDIPGAHQAYADCFEPEGSCLTLGVPYTGEAELLKMREGMWTLIERREHRPETIYRHDNQNYVIYGTAKYDLKNGSQSTVAFFARMIFGDINVQDPKLIWYEGTRRLDD